MILALLEFVVLVVFAIYVEWWRAGERRRQAQTWDRLVAQLRPNGTNDGLSDLSNGQFGWNRDENSTPEERWLKVQGAAGLWAIYENARVMLDMADYAARSWEDVDEELLGALRKDAMEIRVCVLIALTKQASNKVTDGACANVSRAALLYSNMAGRMAELIRIHGQVEVASLAGAA